MLHWWQLPRTAVGTGSSRGASRPLLPRCWIKPKESRLAEIIEETERIVSELMPVGGLVPVNQEDQWQLAVVES